MRNGAKAGVRAVVVSACLGLAAMLGVGAAGCGGGGAATPTERLWVTALPTKPTQSISAFLTMKSGDQYLGSFFRGTLYRGGHDVFKWKDKGKGRAQIELLQDAKKLDLRLAPCEPIKPFDHCLVLESDATGPVKYYSRKRWVVRRPGKNVAPSHLFDATLLELAEDDEELAAALEAAAAVPEDDATAP